MLAALNKTDKRRQAVPKIQNARVRCILHSSQKITSFKGVLNKKQPENTLNENHCYLHSETFFCILNSIESKNLFKNKRLQSIFRMQKVESVGVLHSDANAVTTGVVARFSECTADPLYLRYRKITRANAVNFPIRTKGVFSGSGLGVSQ